MGRIYLVDGRIILKELGKIPLEVREKEARKGAKKCEDQLFTKNTAFSQHVSGCIRSEPCPMTLSESSQFTLWI